MLKEITIKRVEGERCEDCIFWNDEEGECETAEAVSKYLRCRDRESGKEFIFIVEEGGEEDEQKPTWSEEDEKMLIGIISIVRDWYGGACSYTDWLESLKERYIWKPSDEQLDALHDAAVYVKKSMFPYPKGILIELYEQLKKLREE